MPVDINNLSEGWLELESDPGLFTLLLEDFGVKGVQVEEIYDLQKSIEGPVYGFIFLFRWIAERRSRRNIVDQSEFFVKDDEVVNNIFFAQQMVPNSCATHALLSVLLNCPDIHLGSTLSRLKAHTHGMNPENKGWAIGNTPELARAHNSHAMPRARRRLDKSSSVPTGRYTGEAYHFVSYVPIRGRLFELDGLKPFPIDHGPFGGKEYWTEKFRQVMRNRLGISSNGTVGEPYQDIRFNLMAVVPDRRLAMSHKLKMLKTNRQIVLEALQQLVKLTHPQLKNETSESEKQQDEATNKETEKESEGHEDKADELDDSRTETASSSDEKSAPSTPHVSPNPVLETHNYAKNPLVVGEDDDVVESTTDVPADNSTEEAKETEGPKNESGCTLEPPDYSKPLTIQTSPAPSSSSTDTSSEVGSAFNSPTQGWGWNIGQSSPMSTKDIKKFVVIRVASHEDKHSDKHGEGESHDMKETDSRKKHCEEALPDGEPTRKKMCVQSEQSSPKEDDGQGLDGKNDSKLSSKYPELFEPHTFAPKDLLALLRNLESEISVCESNLREENEKRKKYKIDDCRRTHNYDDFICTFLSMLAQQGKLADLVEQHLQMQKKQQRVPVSRITRTVKKAETRTNTRRRRGRTKYRKRK